MVGDPERVGRIKPAFEKIRFETQHREFTTFTGTHEGLEISVMGTGIGMDNTEIALVEIAQTTENPTLIRCGTSGALQSEPDLGDMLISRGAVRLGNTESFYAVDGYPAVADTDVVLALAASCKKLNVPFHVGLTATAPGFYGAQGRKVEGLPLRKPKLLDELTEMKVLNFEMESSTLFTLSSLQGWRAGTICHAVWNRARNEFVEPDKQKQAEAQCLEASLQAFHVIEKMDKKRKKDQTPIWIPEI